MNMPEKPFIYNYSRDAVPAPVRPEVTLIIKRNLFASYVPLNPPDGATRSIELCVQGHYGPGGARRIRTDDILLAKQALYQLSYGPFGRPDKI